MRSKTLFALGAGFCLAAAAAAAAMSPASNRQTIANRSVSQGSSAPKPDVSEPQPAGYKVWWTLRNGDELQQVFLIVSVEPRRFMKEEMLAIARRLNQDYADERRLTAILLDDEDTARNVMPMSTQYSIFQKAGRGVYQLDRVKGEEYIQFSTERGRRTDEIKVTLSRPSAAKSKNRN